jgi:hypothetical protein
MEKEQKLSAVSDQQSAFMQVEEQSFRKAGKEIKNLHRDPLRFHRGPQRKNT